jgi:hypothetical protein
VTAPIVKPLTVTITAVFTAIDDDPVSVRTMALAVGVATEAVSPPSMAAVGLPAGAKKPEG